MNRTEKLALSPRDLPMKYDTMPSNHNYPSSPMESAHEHEQGIFHLPGGFTYYVADTAEHCNSTGIIRPQELPLLWRSLPRRCAIVNFPAGCKMFLVIESLDTASQRRLPSAQPKVTLKI